MKKVFYIVFFINFTFFSSLANASGDFKKMCLQSMRNPELVITTSYGNLEYDNTKSRRTITRMHKNQHKNRAPVQGLLNGLSTFEYALNIKFNLKKQTLYSGVTCVYPSKVTLNIGAGENPKIYIAKDYKEGTCMYDLVLRHEQTHQQINQSVLEYYLPIIKERMLEVVRKNAVAGKNYDISMGMAKNELKDKYLVAMEAILDEIRAETEAEQMKLDNDKNYDYESNICANKN
jgi:hypothetical protein